MKKNTVTKTLAITGVISGVVLLNSTTAHAEEILQNSNTTENEDVNGRIARKGQVINVDGTYLRIRSSASTAATVVGSITEGNTFDIISKNNGWYEIQFNNVRGFVYGEYVQEINSSFNEAILYTGRVYDAEPNLRVRSSSSLNASIIGYVQNESELTIVGIENEWYKIKYNSAYGYVHSDYVNINGNGNTNDNAGGDEAFTSKGYVYNLAGLSLRVRQKPDTTGNIVGSLREGNEVNIIGKVNGWYKILYNNLEAYVSGDYVTLDNTLGPNDTTTNPGSLTNKKGQVINVEGSNLRVRQNASTSSLVLGYLLNNSEVEILGEEGTWYKIKFKETVGYVSKEYIRLIASEAGGSAQQGTYEVIYNAMLENIGAPYVWGGAGERLTTAFINELKVRFPLDAAAGEYSHAEQYVDKGYRAFDCSGLIQWAFARANINVGRTTYDQIKNGVEVGFNELKPGDLLFSKDIGHVGMYIGNDQWIESSYTSDFVRVKNVPWSYVTRARRILN